MKLVASSLGMESSTPERTKVFPPRGSLLCPISTGNGHPLGVIGCPGATVVGTVFFSIGGIGVASLFTLFCVVCCDGPLSSARFEGSELLLGPLKIVDDELDKLDSLLITLVCVVFGAAVEASSVLTRLDVSSALFASLSFTSAHGTGRLLSLLISFGANACGLQKKERMSM